MSSGYMGNKTSSSVHQHSAGASRALIESTGFSRPLAPWGDPYERANTSKRPLQGAMYHHSPNQTPSTFHEATSARIRDPSPHNVRFSSPLVMESPVLQWTPVDSISDGRRDYSDPLPTPRRPVVRTISLSPSPSNSPAQIWLSTRNEMSPPTPRMPVVHNISLPPSPSDSHFPTQDSPLIFEWPVVIPLDRNVSPPHHSLDPRSPLVRIRVDLRPESPVPEIDAPTPRIVILPASDLLSRIPHSDVAVQGLGLFDLMDRGDPLPECHEFLANEDGNAIIWDMRNTHENGMRCYSPDGAMISVARVLATMVTPSENNEFRIGFENPALQAACDPILVTPGRGERRVNADDVLTALDEWARTLVRDAYVALHNPNIRQCLQKRRERCSRGRHCDSCTTAHGIYNAARTQSRQTKAAKVATQLRKEARSHISLTPMDLLGRAVFFDSVAWDYEREMFILRTRVSVRVSREIVEARK